MDKLRGLRRHSPVLVMLGTILNDIDRNTFGVLAPTFTQEPDFTPQPYSCMVAACQVSGRGARMVMGERRGIEPDAAAARA